MIHQFKTDKLGRMAPLSEYEWDDEGVFQNLFNNGQRFLKNVLIVAFYVYQLLFQKSTLNFAISVTSVEKRGFLFLTITRGSVPVIIVAVPASDNQDRDREPLLTFPAKHMELKQTNVAIIRVLKAQVRPICWRANLSMNRVSCMTIAKLFNFPVPPLQNREKKTTHSLGKVM